MTEKYEIIDEEEIFSLIKDFVKSNKITNPEDVYEHPDTVTILVESICENVNLHEENEENEEEYEE